MTFCIYSAIKGRFALDSPKDQRVYGIFNETLVFIDSNLFKDGVSTSETTRAATVGITFGWPRVSVVCGFCFW